MEENYSLLVNYVVLRTLGSGLTSKVKMIRDPSKNAINAAKILRSNSENIIPESYIDAMKTEVQILIQLNHPNIIKILEYNSGGVYQSKKGHTYSCIFMTMELCPYGNLYDIMSQGLLPEPVVRKYFIDILNGLSACHAQGIAHRDIKFENLLFDKNCSIKIADFGFAGYLQGRNGNGLMHTNVGTRPYKAPELHQRLSYNGKLADVFSLGVVLFSMHSRHMPFKEATLTDIGYRLFLENNSKYWKVMSSKHPENFYSNEFICLINSMLAYNPEERIMLNKIRSHPWLAGPVCDISDIAENIRARYNATRRAAEQEKARMRHRNGIQSREGKYYRCADEESLSVSIESLNQNLVIKDYFEEAEIQKYGNIILGITPKEIQTIIYNEVIENQAEYRVLENNNDVMISNFAEFGIVFKVRIYKTKDGLHVVNFQLIEGFHFDMIKIVSRIVSKIHEFQNDSKV